MKLFLSVLLALATLSVSTVNGQLINDQLRGFLMNFRDNMPCMEPPLAPLSIEHFDLNYDFPGTLTLNGYAENIRIDNLNTFEIEHINFNLIGLRVQFTFTIAELPITGTYNVEGSAGETTRFNGEGQFSAIARDITISGNLQMTALGTLSMRSFDATLAVRGMEVDFENLTTDNDEIEDVNRFLETQILRVFDEHSVAVSDIMRDIVMPIANGILNELTLSDLLDMIASGSEETEPCIPPEIK